MFKRLLKYPQKLKQSFFLIGPRGTGKTLWIKKAFPNALYIDLLNTKQYKELLARPHLLEQLIEAHTGEWTIIDEIQKIPPLLDEVHRLIESKGVKFGLTGSSVRSLHKKGVNLLAGRALMFHMFPLSFHELGKSFHLPHSLKYGQLPAVYSKPNPDLYLETYINTYLRQEVLQEGLTRNLGTFTQMLEVASFSQGSILNYSEIAREIGANRKLVESYFQIIDDLLIGIRLPPFTKRAKRRLIAHPKFYFVDVGIYRALRPRGPLNTSSEIEAPPSKPFFCMNFAPLMNTTSSNTHCTFGEPKRGRKLTLFCMEKKGFMLLKSNDRLPSHPKIFAA